MMRRRGSGERALQGEPPKGTPDLSLSSPASHWSNQVPEIVSRAMGQPQRNYEQLFPNCFWMN